MRDVVRSQYEASPSPSPAVVVTFPSASGREAARQMRQAFHALAKPRMSLRNARKSAWKSGPALRPDHPIRRTRAGSPVRPSPAVPGLDRFVAGSLSADERHWTLEEADRLLDQAGLQFLDAATRGIRPTRGAQPRR